MRVEIPLCDITDGKDYDCDIFEQEYYFEAEKWYEMDCGLHGMFLDVVDKSKLVTFVSENGEVWYRREYGTAYTGYTYIVHVELEDGNTVGSQYSTFWEFFYAVILDPDYKRRRHFFQKEWYEGEDNNHLKFYVSRCVPDFVGYEYNAKFGKRTFAKNVLNCKWCGPIFARHWNDGVENTCEAKKASSEPVSVADAHVKDPRTALKEWNPKMTDEQIDKVVSHE